MKPHEGQYFSDDLARGFASVHQIKGVRRRRVVNERDGQIVNQRLGEEAVDR
jgi:hypothetical protein